ncbi:pseudouridine synthase [Hoyosella rhizosphaerae]|uniref:RNA pseudouridylate synthase n=1 Tax=Hoyosella rhizosphaerae TaxID=1755582 RepID=A0A916U736_9ACTN|nr:pseudouridine synthase [Hoyosella rhizosphaerae]MBN4927790.1 pseudouridine synthase [Hoyosella rhizosphaerae]GGC61517.1 hypothetical protein GCM10011410_12480 [Hoyosella rhizosphaerae]
MPHPSPTRASPLPPRDGVDAAWIRFPDNSPWKTVGDAIFHRYPDHWDRFSARLANGDVIDAEGKAVAHATPVVNGMTLYYYRDLPDETPPPRGIHVLHQDKNLVVADKPHFMATMPRGRHIRYSATVLLRQQLGLPELSPVHRLDRPTAGVLMFATNASVRAPYQQLFARRAVEKMYEAIASAPGQVEFPQTVRNRIVKVEGNRQAAITDGEVNAITHIELARLLSETHALYRLTPLTGRTHQLRIHMNSLGLPLIGDDLYPDIKATATDDFSAPLQLLARSVTFVDPISGSRRSFTSEQTLDFVQKPR